MQRRPLPGLVPISYYSAQSAFMIFSAQPAAQYLRLPEDAHEHHPIHPLRLAPKAINWSIALSVFLIIAGLFALLLPFISGVAITLFFGWAMILSGITHLIFAFKTHTTGGRIWEVLIGLIYLFTRLLSHPPPARRAPGPHSHPRPATSSSRPSSSSFSTSNSVPATAPAGSSSTASSP